MYCEQNLPSFRCTIDMKCVVSYIQWYHEYNNGTMRLLRVSLGLLHIYLYIFHYIHPRKKVVFRLEHRSVTSRPSQEIITERPTDQRTHNHLIDAHQGSQKSCTFKQTLSLGRKENPANYAVTSTILIHPRIKDHGIKAGVGENQPLCQFKYRDKITNLACQIWSH